MAEQKNENIHYELDIYTVPYDSANHVSLSFTGMTYDEVLAKAKQFNVDIATLDLDKWSAVVYYRGDCKQDGGVGIVESVYLSRRFWDDIKEPVAWDGCFPITEDPIVRKQTAREVNERAERELAEAVAV
jgi:hypothetical protein